MDDQRADETTTIDPAVLDDRIWAGLQHAASLGIVAVTEAGMTDWGYLESLLRLRERHGRLPVAVRLLVASGLADGVGAGGVLTRRTGDPWVEVVGIKFYGDGWLGPRTCALCDPFADRPGNTGILFLDADTVARRSAPYAEAGLTLATHAIGDRAVAAVLDGYERVWSGDRVALATARPRIEHAQVLSTELVSRLGELGVAACIQPSFAVSDRAAALAGLGAERADAAYDWQGLLAAAVPVLAGSDYPIETLSPLQGLADLSSGPGRSRLAVAVAFALMTDPLWGTVELSDDPRATPVGAIPDLTVIATDATPLGPFCSGIS